MDQSQILTQELVGWTDPTAALKNSGVEMVGFGNVTLDYYNPVTRLSIEAHTDENYLRTHILRKSDESGVTLILPYQSDEQLKSILRSFVKHQDSVTPENTQELVTELAALSPGAAIETQDGLQTL